MNKIITILIGPPGSGKSTFAEKLIGNTTDSIVLSRDAYRKMLRLKLENGNEKLEKLITKMLYADLRLSMKSGWNIIVDNTHCRVSAVIELIENIKKSPNFKNYTVEFKFFDVDLKELKNRNLTRPAEKMVPVGVIERMFTNFQSVNCDLGKKQINDVLYNETPEVNKFDPKLPNAVIVDIDGTIAHMNGKRGPFDWNKVDVDDPDPAIINLVYTLSQKHKIIFMSGRSEEAREKTVLWLETYLPGIKYNLFMRGLGDYRSDDITKFELYDNNVNNKYNIIYVLDDRQQVVDMWRRIGLKVLQVAEGDF